MSEQLMCAGKAKQDISLPLDCWWHAQSTVTLLYLAICQIQSSVAESNLSIEQLTDTFTQLAQQRLNDSGPQATQHLSSDSDTEEKIKQAITAFQFYDRISQRLDHVAAGLFKMSELFKDIENLNNPNRWRQIQSEIQAGYSMDSERMMFDQIMDGASVEETLASYIHGIQTQRPPSDDIELF